MEFTQIPRSHNMGSDELAKQSLSEARPMNTGLKIDVQNWLNIEEVLTFTI